MCDFFLFVAADASHQLSESEKQLRSATLAGFSVPACISVSLQNEIISGSSQVAIVFLNIASLFKYNFNEGVYMKVS